MTKTLWTAICVILVLSVGGNVWAQDGEATPEASASGNRAIIGYVDIEAAIRSVDDGQAAMERLSAQLAERQAALDATEEELRAFTAQLEQDIVLLDEEERVQRLQDYQARVGAYQEQYMSNQEDLLALEAEATREIVERMVALVAEISGEQGLEMVFEKTRSALVWAHPATDLTPELIRRYEERH